MTQKLTPVQAEVLESIRLLAKNDRYHTWIGSLEHGSPAYTRMRKPFRASTILALYKKGLIRFSQEPKAMRSVQILPVEGGAQ